MLANKSNHFSASIPLVLKHTWQSCIESCLCCSLCEMQVVLLTKAVGGMCSLQICGLPRLNTVYELELSGFSWLTDCPAHQVCGLKRAAQIKLVLLIHDLCSH